MIGFKFCILQHYRHHQHRYFEDILTQFVNRKVSNSIIIEMDSKIVENKQKEARKRELIKVADHAVNKVTLIHYLGISLWLGWFFFYAYLPFALILLYWWSKTGFVLFLVIFTTAYFLPIDRELQPADVLCITPLLRSDYNAVNESGPAIWSIEPHDVLPLGLFAMSDYLGYFPGHKMIGCLTGACFIIPGMKHVFTWASACSVDKKSLQKLLRTGHSPTVCPGGAMEVTFLNHKKECTMYIKKRFGLVKLAMQYGYPLIPTVCYNQRDAFSFYVPKHKLLHKLGRLIGFMPMLICGVGNIPFAQPKSMPLQVVVGLPIKIPKIEGKPSDEEVQKYHTLFVQATEKLFEDHKAQFGMGDITLIVK